MANESPAPYIVKNRKATVEDLIKVCMKIERLAEERRMTLKEALIEAEVIVRFCKDSEIVMEMASLLVRNAWNDVQIWDDQYRAAQQKKEG